jgi:hypothetical protein
LRAGDENASEQASVGGIRSEQLFEETNEKDKTSVHLSTFSLDQPQVSTGEKTRGSNNVSGHLKATENRGLVVKYKVPENLKSIPDELLSLPEGVYQLNKNEQLTIEQEKKVKSLIYSLNRATMDTYFYEQVRDAPVFNSPLERQRYLAHVLPVLYKEEQDFDKIMISTGVMDELFKMEAIMVKTLALRMRHKRVSMQKNWVELCAFSQKFASNKAVLRHYGDDLSVYVTDFDARDRMNYSLALRLYIYLAHAAEFIEEFLYRNDRDCTDQAPGLKPEKLLFFLPKTAQNLHVWEKRKP